MKNKSLKIALSFYKIAVPVFISLKEEYSATARLASRENSVNRTLVDEKELTFTKLRVLFAIEYGKDQVGKLARGARVAQPAMSKLVNHLIDLGLVRRAPHPTDRRQIKLSLTTKGLGMTDRVRLKAAEKYRKSIKNLSERDRKKIIDGISVILKVLEKTKGENS